MKNVTITLQEDVARWARVWAAEHDVSVSRMVGEMLKERMLSLSEYETAMSSFLRRGPRRISRRGPYPRREGLYER